MISIIIPVYNHEEALWQSLRSIAQQTYKDVEVIVVDDGSDKEFRIQNSELRIQVTCIRQDHAGAPSARNNGFRASKGEYVIFWDADVVAEPDMLENMLRELTEHLEASFAYSNFYFGKQKPFGLAQGKMPAQKFNVEELKKINYIHSTSLIRREAVVPWDESLKRFQDWDLWLTMVEQGKKGIWIPEYLFRVLPRKNGMSSWLPSFAYRSPWKYLPGIKSRVQQYEAARQIVWQKHVGVK